MFRIILSSLLKTTNVANFAFDLKFSHNLNKTSLTYILSGRLTFTPYVFPPLMMSQLFTNLSTYFFLSHFPPIHSFNSFRPYYLVSL